MSAGKANYYLELAREDYYLSGGEPEGKWYGTGAASLGLEGAVCPADLRNLFRGYSPLTGLPLTQRQHHEGRASHRAGWDFTFSPPKSVSVFWGQARPEIRSKIEAVHERAVKQALDYIERVAGQTRCGKGGKRIEPAKLTFALFEHGTSRRLDPCLHTHCLLLNVALCRDGKTRAVSSMAALKVRKTADTIYQSALRNALESELNLETRPVRHWFELAAVPQLVRNHFSKRRIEIEQEVAEKGNSSPRAVAMAAISTRSAKEHVSRTELYGKWSAECDSLGWRSSDADFACAKVPSSNPPHVDLRSLAEPKGFFTIDAVVRSIASSTRRFVDTTDLVEQAQRAIEREAVPLGNGRYSVPVVARYASISTQRSEDLPSTIAQSLHSGKNIVVVYPNPPFEPLVCPDPVKAMPIREVLALVTDSNSKMAFLLQEVLGGKTPKELIYTFGPDLTEPFRNAIYALEKYLRRNGPNLGRDIRAMLDRYGPDISELYRTLAKGAAGGHQHLLTSGTSVYVEQPEKISARDLLALETACDLAGSKLAYFRGDLTPNNENSPELSLAMLLRHEQGGRSL